MDKKESFIFYRSFAETAKLVADPRERLVLYEALITYGLDGEKPELEYPLNAILEQMTASVKSAADRYAAAKGNGERGGRPRKWIPPDEWQAYRREHTQKETAEHFGISVDTLQRWEKAAKPQNLNVNVNDNENLNVNDNSNSNYQNNNKKEKEKAATPKTLKGVSATRFPPIDNTGINPCMPGYQFEAHGHRYKFNDEREVVDLGPI